MSNEVFVYRVKDRYSFEFVKVLATKVTTASVFIGGTRCAKSADGVRYFEDFESARDYAMFRLRQKRERALKEMESAENNLRYVEGIKDETIQVTDKRW